MDRRDTIKSLFLGSLAGGFAITACSPEEAIESANIPLTDESNGYGRTEREKLIDEKLFSESYLLESELNTLSVLVDLILPATSTSGSATEAGVTEFIDFIVKDIPRHQIPIRGGLMWLDQLSNRLNNLVFVSCSQQQQKEILDMIAYPDKAEPTMLQGVNFFSLLRNLTLTGFYTTRMGFENLGYKGNQPNVWDGVPEDILQKHGLSYEPEWLEKCIDQEKRMDIASWDENGNLIS